jgi:hypothetical protein
MAAVLFWSFPTAFVWWQTRPMLFYLPTVVLGLTIVLCAQRLNANPSRTAYWLVLGLAAGLGWWTSPHILYFLVPVMLWLLTKRSRSVLRHGWIALPAFVIGAGPWLIYNIVHAWPSVANLPTINADPLDRLEALFFGGLPIALGTKVPFTEEWIRPILGPLVYAIGLGAIVTAVRTTREETQITVWLLTWFVILWALIPAEAYVGSGRYFFFLSPTIALLLSSVPKADTGRIAILVCCVGLTAFGLFLMRDIPVGFVPDIDPLIQGLNAADVDHVVTGYWVAYKLVWETNEEIVATPRWANRYPAYTDEVRQANRVAYVYNGREPAQLENAQAMREFIAVGNLSHVELVAGEYVVIIPGRVVVPEATPENAIPYP